jgi:hypothetical protein
MSEDDGLSRPLSYGEKRALEEQRKIAGDRGKAFEPPRAPVVDPDLKKVRRS